MSKLYAVLGQGTQATIEEVEIVNDPRRRALHVAVVTVKLPNGVKQNLNRERISTDRAKLVAGVVQMLERIAVEHEQYAEEAANTAKYTREKIRALQGKVNA